MRPQKILRELRETFRLSFDYEVKNMDANAQYELYLIKKELQAIIDELDSISGGIRRDFSGIGNERCAVCVSNSAQHYREVKAQLERMDLSALSEEFLAKRQEEERKAAVAQAQRQASYVATTQSVTTTQKASSGNIGSKSTQTKNITVNNNSKSTMTSIVEKGLKSIGNAIKGAFSWLK